MTISFKRVLGIVALAGAVGACASHAATEAKFHLPVTAHWGGAVLAPGDYKIRIQDQTFGANNMTVQGEGKTAYEMPLAVDARQATGANIQMVKVNGDYFVQQFRSDLTGKVYTFSVPKSKKATGAKMDVAASESSPVMERASR